MNMKLIRTVKIKLNVDPKVFEKTINVYTKAFNFVCQTGWDDKDFNGVSLHHKTYKVIKENLPSQLAVSARMKATESLKSVRAKLKKKKKTSCPQSKQISIRYDARSYNMWFDRNEISILTVEGRKKFSINIPEYFKQYISWKRCSADLFIRKGKVFINIVFSKEISDTEFNGNVVGIDRGINKIAVTSQNVFYDGGEIKRISKRYERLRKNLQSCGSKSAKRHLRKISKKENRFRADVNHCITKKIVKSLEPGTIISLEKLTGIRQNVKLRKNQRKELHKWNFFQFEQFITYKAEREGIKIEYVDARYTSQKCSVCGHISRSNRQYQCLFKCKQCGFSLNADLNASRNIKQNYLNAICYSDRGAVNHPNVENDVSKAVRNCTNA